jgi:hypothetical protein
MLVDLRFVLAFALLGGSLAGAQEETMRTFSVWAFNQWNDCQGWAVPPELGGRVWGGSLWLTLEGLKNGAVPEGYSRQMGAGPLFGPIVSPPGMAVSVEGNVKVRMRILNRSAETDGLVWWRLSANPDADAGVRRFSMKPYSGRWQEVVCDLAGAQGRLTQIRIQPYVHGLKGDVFIDRIAVTDGEQFEAAPKPDVCSEAVVPSVNLPGVTQEEFQDAFRVLDECIFVDVPVMGFEYPVMGPGGAYGENWWQLDTSLNQAGTKWVNQTFSENTIRGFIGVQHQNPDGRIDLWGGAPGRGQPGDVSSIPRYFEIAYDVARRSSDPGFRDAVYASMTDYLDWWLSPVKRKEPTGLISATAEETFGASILDPPGVLAAVDTNVAVAVGCWNVSDLAARLGKLDEAEYYRNTFEDLKQSINTYLWDEEKGFYCNYNLFEGRRIPRLLCSTFDTLRLNIATRERAVRLLEKLTDPALFNWGGRAITSIAKTEPDYVEATGPYDGRAWYGDIWAMRNMPVIAGLEDVGRYDLAADLAWSTIASFNDNYCEYVVPSTGSGEGVQRYGWSASQYIQSIVEHVFGVDYDAMKDRLVVAPNLPVSLGNTEVSLRDLQLCDTNRRLDVQVARHESGAVTVTLQMRGTLPAELWIAAPTVQGTATLRDGRHLELQPIPGKPRVLGIAAAPARALEFEFLP